MRSSGIVVALCLGLSVDIGRAGDGSLSPFTAQSSWPTIHRDSSNSDFVPFVEPEVNRVKWSALDGAAILLAPTVGPEGHLYVTTGQGPGTSHLHAFDRDGNLLWESPPQQTLDDLDSSAVGSAPAVDRDGDVYVSDANQFWAFHPDGTLKWVVDLPRTDQPFVSAVFTHEGYVGGITTGGDVIFVHREDGSLAAPLLSLPGGMGPAGPPLPPGLWAGGLMDPTIIRRTYHTFFGYESEVANTPAVSPSSGRMFITAAGPERTQGVLYGIDFVDGQWTIAFQSPLAAGSGTSPAISPDGKQVYAVGGDRVLVAFDSSTGAPRWRTGNAGSASSPAVGPDGTIYSGDQAQLTALNPDDGSVHWRINFDGLAGAYLPRILPNSNLPSGTPIAQINSVVTVTPTHLLVAVVLGYAITLPDTGKTPPQPRFTLLCSVDSANGTLKSKTLVRDTSEGVISAGSDGRLYFSHAALLSSVAYFGVNPVLPPRLQVDGPPLAGLSALEPVSYQDHATKGVQRIQDLANHARIEIPGGDLDYASAELRKAASQLLATMQTVSKDARIELGDSIANQVQSVLISVGSRLATASDALRTNPLSAATEIDAAQGGLNAAILRLTGRPTLHIEVFPGTCPKEIEFKKSRSATMDVAVLGAPNFEIWRLNLASITLSRLDGVGGVVFPLRRLQGLSGRFADVATPNANGICSCQVSESDGLMDRILLFSIPQVVSTLELESLPPHATVPLKMTGTLIDGTSFHATDCVTIASGSRGK